MTDKVAIIIIVVLFVAASCFVISELVKYEEEVLKVKKSKERERERMTRRGREALLSQTWHFTASPFPVLFT